MSKDIYSVPAAGNEEMMNICLKETRERISETLDLCLPLADTPEGRLLMEEQLYSIFIQSLAYIQAGNRRFRKERQREGIETARAKGVHFGRKQKFIAENYIDVFRRLKNGEIDKNTARAEIGASPNTFIKLLKEAGEKGLI